MYIYIYIYNRTLYRPSFKTVTTRQNVVEDRRVQQLTVTFNSFFRPSHLVSVHIKLKITHLNLTAAANGRLQKKDRRQTEESKRQNG